MGPGGTKTVGDLPVRFLEPVFFFVGWTCSFFFDNYDLGFFFGAVHLLRGPCLQKGGTQLL